MPGVNINEIICKPGSERAILSIILHNNERIVDCETGNLYAEHFAVKGHSYIYSSICYLFGLETITIIDSLAIYNTITDPAAKQAVDELGGMEYVDNLFHARVADNIAFYVKQVKTAAIKRLAYNMGADIQNLCINSEEDDIDELMHEIQDRTLQLQLESESRDEIYKMGTNAEERLRRRVEHPTTIPGFTLGWRKFDKYTQGYKGNELTVWVGESKTGKSTMLLNHCYKLSVVDGIPGLYIDTEMTDEEQEDRLIAIVSEVPYEEIVNGMYSRDTEYGIASDKIARVARAVERIRQAPLYHIYMPDFTINKVSSITRQYQIRHNVGYMIFDYIKLPTSEIGGLASAQEYQRLGFITTCLKDIAGICDIPVITAAQANRSALGSVNQDASNIGGSYRILQMATRLIFIRNKTDIELAGEGIMSGNQKVNIAYQRNGASNCDNINLQFDKAILKMREI